MGATFPLETFFQGLERAKSRMGWKTGKMLLLIFSGE
jgi:hypothetical protein